MNPIYQASSNNNINALYKEFMTSKNPMQLFIKYASQNPSLQPYLQMIRSGGSPENIAKNLLQKKGIDPYTFINNFNFINK